MIHAVLVFNKQSKMRLQKWYSCECDRERFTKSIAGQICSRDKTFSSILEYLGYKIVFKKFASLFFAVCIDTDDNEFDALNIIGLFVEMLDSQFGSVCELDMIFEFERSYQILDEILLAGHLQESSKTEVSFIQRLSVNSFIDIERASRKRCLGWRAQSDGSSERAWHDLGQDSCFQFLVFFFNVLQNPFYLSSTNFLQCFLHFLHFWASWIFFRMYKFMILFSRQGKIRLTKWFHSIPGTEFHWWFF